MSVTIFSFILEAETTLGLTKSSHGQTTQVHASTPTSSHILVAASRKCPAIFRASGMVRQAKNGEVGDHLPVNIGSILRIALMSLIVKGGSTGLRPEILGGNYI